MQTRSKDSGQKQLFDGLEKMLNPKEPLYQLARVIPWKKLEGEFSRYYIKYGRPAKPTRCMISLLLLKQLYNISDEEVVSQWTHNPYWQYLSGEEQFKWEVPCTSSELTHFRKRIGKEGIERIFRLSVELHKKKFREEKEVVIDTTVQEKNITYPTDVKQYRKIAAHCVKIAETEGIGLRRSYRRTIPKLLYAQRGRNHPRGHKKAVRAQRKLKTIAGRLVRELTRKLPREVLEVYADHIELFNRVLTQKRGDKNKVYSLHEPHVYCISKGKEHKKYEFGSKVSIAMTKRSGIIVSAMNIEKNVYDGATLPDVLEDIKRQTGKRPTVAIVDQGYRGKKEVEETQIISAHVLRKKLTNYEKHKTRKRLRRRAAIEPVIGHLKSEFRLARNYLKGVIGDHINVLLAAAAYNLRKWLRMASSFILLILRRDQFRVILTFGH
jgi:IS5 family transposase